MKIVLTVVMNLYSFALGILIYPIRFAKGRIIICKVLEVLAVGCRICPQIIGFGS